MKISRKVPVCMLKISGIGSHAIVWLHETERAAGQIPKSECGSPSGRGIENHMYATRLLKILCGLPP